jgi:microcystin degradation protein MlrC
MKAALAQFIFETNTFSSGDVEIDVFKDGGVWCDTESDVRRWSAGTISQMQGSLKVLEAAGWETAPAFVAVCRSPAGRLSVDCFRQVRDALFAGLRAAAPFDVLILHLHGAACAVGEDDTEGQILEKARTELEFRGPVVLSLDLHANFTRRMLEHADAVTAYHTFPHMDFSETGERAARLALRNGPFTREAAKIAALVPPTDSTHFEGHFADVLAKARELEQLEEVLDVCVLPVQPWMDIDEMGSSIVVTASAEGVPRKELETLANEWFDQRHDWDTRMMEWPTIVEALKCGENRPRVLVDGADATSGGSPGTSVEALRQLLPFKHQLPGKVLLWVVCPATVEAAGKGATRFVTGDPSVEWEGRVLWTGEGNYRARGKAYTGLSFSMGEAVVIESGRLQLVACTYPALSPDPAFYECVGLRPGDALAVQAKSMIGWMAGFEMDWDRGLPFDGPGACSLNFAGMPFRGSAKELFPMNPEPSDPVEIWT